MLGYILGNWGAVLSLTAMVFAGFYHWPWWVVMTCALCGALAREWASGFRTERIARVEGVGFAIRVAIMYMVIFAVVWTIGYGLSRT